MRALNHLQISSLTNAQLDDVLDGDEYDEVTVDLAAQEYDLRAYDESDPAYQR